MRHLNFPKQHQKTLRLGRIVTARFKPHNQVSLPCDVFVGSLDMVFGLLEMVCQQIVVHVTQDALGGPISPVPLPDLVSLLPRKQLPGIG